MVCRRPECVCVGLVTVLALSCGLHQAWAIREEKLGLEVEWVFNTSDQFEGMMFGAGLQGPPSVWDIDGDGAKEVMWGTRRGHSKRLWCIGTWPTPEIEWIYPPMSQDGLPGDPTSKVSLVDVDNDGVYELALAGRGGRLHIINPDGSVWAKWDEPEQQNMHGAPQAYDVDGDGLLEFFLNTNNGFIHRVDVVGQGLAYVWTSAQSGAGNQGHPTICDIDQDGSYEVVYASQDFNVYCLDAGTGSEKWRFNMEANMETNQVIVADVNNDGEFEAVAWVGQPTSAVIVISRWGEEISRWTLPREGINMRLCQVMGDLDHDGSMDMAVMSGDAVYAITIGTKPPQTMWEIDFTEYSERGILPAGAQANHWGSYQTIADIDGDGELEILWLAPFPIVTDATTGRVEAYYVNQHIATNRRPDNGGWWGDVDDDGISEWICELNGNSHPQTQLYALTMGGVFPAESPWPEYYHSAYPAQYQQQQDWLTLKGAYSNSLWLHIHQIPSPSILSILGLILLPALLRGRQT